MEMTNEVPSILDVTASEEEDEDCSVSEYEMTSWSGKDNEPSGFRMKGKKKFPKAVEFFRLKL